MKTKFSLVIALIVAGFFPALSLYSWHTQTEKFTGEGAVEVAVRFLRNGPTFKFDGIHNSIAVVETWILESYPVQYVITITFESRHAGYGDRTGQALAQVITPHEMKITVVEGKVISAIIDDAWDELSQREIRSELLLPEFAKDLAVEYILKNHPEIQAIPTPETWKSTILTPEGLVGASTQQFVGNGWTVNVSYPIVQHPKYTVEIEYTNEVRFNWEGTVDQNGNVAETDFHIAK
jgi:hypothetical protein